MAHRASHLRGDSLKQVTEYTYDDRDNLVSLKDAKGNVTGFAYDRNNRMVKESRPMGQETSYQYDGVGNLVRKVDAKQQKVEYGYDDAGRLGEIRYYAAAGDGTPVKTVSFTYDKVGSLTSYNDVWIVWIGDVPDILTFFPEG